MPTALVTDSSLCTYDLDPTTPAKNFRLVFTLDPDNSSCRKLTASNPGQTFFNVFDTGTPGQQITFTMVLPYPFVTQGANPLHAYDGVTFVPNPSGACLLPGNGIGVTVTGGVLPVTLASYGGAPVIGTSTYSLTVKVTVPATGFVYVNLHLDYGFKGQGNFQKKLIGSDANAVKCSNVGVTVVPDHRAYTFGVTGHQVGSDFITNINEFKKDPPGVAGLCQFLGSQDPVMGATLTLKKANGSLAGTATSDMDGFYLINYKHQGSPANYTLKMTWGSYQSTRTITMRANSFQMQNFTDVVP
jgi:hypothetical protein